MKTLHPIKLCADFNNIFFLFVEQTNHTIIIIFFFKTVKCGKESKMTVELNSLAYSSTAFVFPKYT